MCPFCYIGKRRFEAALAQFDHANDVQVVWKSFQLDPALKTDPDQDVYQYLVENKGVTREQAIAMNQQVTEMAREVGLDYHLDQAVLANSFDAHRLIQLARQHNLGDAAEERLFYAYFTEGANIADRPTLVKLGEEIGLAAPSITRMFETGTLVKEVEEDIREAQQLGARGVPFFVIDRQYGISGAQPTDVFLSTLTQAHQKIAEASARSTASEGDTCAVDGSC